MWPLLCLFLNANKFLKMPIARLILLSLSVCCIYLSFTSGVPVFWLLWHSTCFPLFVPSCRFSISGSSVSTSYSFLPMYFQKLPSDRISRDVLRAPLNKKNFCHMSKWWETQIHISFLVFPFCLVHDGGNQVVQLSINSYGFMEASGATHCSLIHLTNTYCSLTK